MTILAGVIALFIWGVVYFCEAFMEWISGRDHTAGWIVLAGFILFILFTIGVACMG